MNHKTKKIYESNTKYIISFSCIVGNLIHLIPIILGHLPVMNNRIILSFMCYFDDLMHFLFITFLPLAPTIPIPTYHKLIKLPTYPHTCRQYPTALFASSIFLLFLTIFIHFSHILSIWIIFLKYFNLFSFIQYPLLYFHILFIILLKHTCKLTAMPINTHIFDCIQYRILLILC